MLACTQNRLSSLFLLAALGCLACGGSAPPPETAPPATEAASEPAQEDVDMAEPAEQPAELDAGDQAPSEDGPAEAATASNDLSAGETRTMQVIQKTVLDNRDRFRVCYDVVEADQPGIQGDLTLYFVLDAEGRVKEAELNEARSTLKQERLVECALSELRKLRFPPSSKGLETKVNYPFNFNPR